jgi:ParB family transcriptional regulator, chromosome partitioning protein
MNHPSGLGRGLSSLIPKLNQPGQIPAPAEGQLTDEKIIQVPLELIAKNPFQPRENFDYNDLEDLVESIKKHGILQPLVVTKSADGYQLIAGERRFRAAEIIGSKTVPVIVRTATNNEKLELALIENLQRQNLNPIEEARAYQKLISEFNLTQEEAALRVGKKRTTVANTLRMLDLPAEIQQALAERKITPGHAKIILSVESEPERFKLYKKIINTPLTVRDADAAVKKVQVKTHERKIHGQSLEILDQEDQLRKALNTKVKISSKGEGGQIVIDYYSAEELANLVEKLVK